MKRLAVILIALLVVGALTGAIVPRLLSFQNVYSASAVAQGLQREPGRWVGRTVLVHGMPLGEITSASCAPSSSPQAPCRQTTWLRFGTAGPGVVWLQARSWRSAALRRLAQVVTIAHPVVPVGAPIPIHPLAPLPRGTGRFVPPTGQPRPALGWGPITFISVGGLAPDLTLLVRPGVHAPTPRPLPGWLACLHGLPLVGPALQHLFPWDGGVTVRVHLTKASCGATPCANGTLIES